MLAVFKEILLGVDDRLSCTTADVVAAVAGALYATITSSDLLYSITRVACDGHYELILMFILTYLLFVYHDQHSADSCDTKNDWYYKTAHYEETNTIQTNVNEHMIK